MPRSNVAHFYHQNPVDLKASSTNPFLTFDFFADQ